MKLANASKLKILSFDNTEVVKLDDRYIVEKLRVMHFANCSMKAIAAPKVFAQAGASLKKVNLSHNMLTTIPAELFEQCTMIESFIVSSNKLDKLPSQLCLLTKLTELDLSGNRFADFFGFSSEQEATDAFPQSLKVLNLAQN
mmetsp:Transcript_31398/g.41588  ORF Transcript_31398/g.41588 Transcript_31398/m.41588 type:complete len:143 (-) Transcript_31398:405-833(-)